MKMVLDALCDIIIAYFNPNKRKPVNLDEHKICLEWASAIQGHNQMWHMTDKLDAMALAHNLITITEASVANGVARNIF